MSTSPYLPGTPVPRQPIRRRSWFDRNWKWTVPLAIVCAIALGAGLVASVLGFIKNSGPYQEALQRAESDPRVTARLGGPVKAGYLVSGSVTARGADRGNADLSIRIKGPKGEGTVHAVATKSGGKWRFEELDVVVAGDPARIDLLATDVNAPLEQ